MSDSQPNGSQSSSSSPLTYVVDLCERFELDWRGGGTPRIETYLEGVGAGERDRLLRELLAMEVELRISQGENPTPEKLHSAIRTGAMRSRSPSRRAGRRRRRLERECGDRQGRGRTAMRSDRRAGFRRVAPITPI